MVTRKEIEPLTEKNAMRLADSEIVGEPFGVLAEGEVGVQTGPVSPEEVVEVQAAQAAALGVLEAPPSAPTQETEQAENGNGDPGPRVQFGLKDYPPTYSELHVEFLESCKKQCGSLKAAWKLFSEDGNPIDFVTFCRGVRKLGFQGSLKQTWDTLGEASTAMVLRVEDLSPAADLLFQTWKNRLLGKNEGKTFYDVWRERGAMETMSCADFLKWVAEDLEFTPLDAEMMVEWLDQDGDLLERQFLRLAEVDDAAGAKIVKVDSGTASGGEAGSGAEGRGAFGAPSGEEAD